MDEENAYWYMKFVCILVHEMNTYFALFSQGLLKESIPLSGLDWMSNEGGFVACSLHISKQCKTHSSE